MDLLRIFLWFLKEKDVLCEFRKIYNNYTLKHRYTIYDHDDKCYKMVTSMPFNKAFNRAITNSYSGQQVLSDIFYELLPYSWVDNASKKLLNAEKRWRYFVKHNILMLNEIKTGDTLTMSNEKIEMCNCPCQINDFIVETIRPNGDIEIKGEFFNTIIPLTHFDMVNGEKIEYYIKRRNKIYKGNAKVL